MNVGENNIITDGDEDLYSIKQPVCITGKYNHTWIESVKKIPKWADKKVKIEELIHYITTSINVDCKDIYDICSLIKILINDNILAINVCGLRLVNSLCQTGRKGFRQSLKSEIAQILFMKLKDKKLNTESLNTLLQVYI